MFKTNLLRQNFTLQRTAEKKLVCLYPQQKHDVFSATSENHYNLRNHNDFGVSFSKTVYHNSTENISYLGPKLQDVVPTILKNQ